MELPEDQEGLPGRDFFGGTLAGITEKLDYLKGLCRLPIETAVVQQQNRAAGTGKPKTVPNQFRLCGSLVLAGSLRL